MPYFLLTSFLAYFTVNKSVLNPLYINIPPYGKCLLTANGHFKAILPMIIQRLTSFHMGTIPRK